MESNASAMTLDRLAEMVQEGFLDMGDRFDRVESDICILKEDVAVLKGDVSQLKCDVGQLKEDMVEVKQELPKFATVNMHQQLAGRVGVIESHIGI